MSTIILQVESSPGPISPGDDRHNLNSSGSGNSTAATSSSLRHNQPSTGQQNQQICVNPANMPLSDNNVSTTNMALNSTWEMAAPAATNATDSEQDINVSYHITSSQ